MEERVLIFCQLRVLGKLAQYQKSASSKPYSGLCLLGGTYSKQFNSGAGCHFQKNSPKSLAYLGLPMLARGMTVGDGGDDEGDCDGGADGGDSNGKNSRSRQDLWVILRSLLRFGWT